MKAKYKVKVNKAGLIFIGITIFLGVAAVNTANNLLYIVVSYMLSFMLLSGILSLYNLRGLEITLLPPEEIYAGTPFSFRVMLKNRKKIPSFLIEIKKDKNQVVFPFLGNKAEDELSLTFEKRGYYKKIELEVSSSFPVGLFDRFYKVEVPIELVVFPKPIPTPEIRLNHLGKEREMGAYTNKKMGYDDLYGIKEYSGEPIKLIHWKAFAKTENLYVKNMIEESAPPVILSLDTVDGNIEERISKLTYLVLKLTEQGRPVGLKLPQNTIEPSTGQKHKRRILTELALL